MDWGDFGSAGVGWHMRPNELFVIWIAVLAVLGCDDVAVYADIKVLEGNHSIGSLNASAGRTFYAAPQSAPTGMPVGQATNDGVSPSRPFLISSFWQVAKPGDTLLLLDGYYTGRSSMIDALERHPINGTQAEPIVIRALNDGAVLIDGEHEHLPLCIQGTFQVPKRHFVVEGINLCNSFRAVLTLSHCDDCTVRRVCAWNAHPNKNAHVYTLHCTSRCLLEDCAGWGLGRKQLLIYGGAENQAEPYGADNVVRRFWCRWEGTRYRGYHSENISFQYRAIGTLLENVICTYDAWPSIEYPPDWTFSGFFYTDGPAEHIADTRLLGCIGYALKEARVLTPYVFLITGTDVLDVTLRDCLSYIAPDRGRGLADYEIRGLVTNARYYNSVRVEHLTIVGGSGIKIGARQPEVLPDRPVVENVLVMKTADPLQWYQAAIIGTRHVDGVYFFDNAENFEPLRSCTEAPTNILSPAGYEAACTDIADINLNCRTAKGTDPLLHMAGRSLLRPDTSPTLADRAPDGTDVGARLWFRYVDGLLMTNQTEGGPQYLWPWPMEDRIWKATLEYHLLDPENHPQPVSVTWEVLTLDGGALPGDCDGDGDVDEIDRATFEGLCPAPDISIIDANAFSLDFDEDGDIDDADRRVFQRWYGYDRPSFRAERIGHRGR
jgi:hypothetical protein